MSNRQFKISPKQVYSKINDTNTNDDVEETATIFNFFLSFLKTDFKKGLNLFLIICLFEFTLRAVSTSHIISVRNYGAGVNNVRD